MRRSTGRPGATLSATLAGTLAAAALGLLAAAPAAAAPPPPARYLAPPDQSVVVKAGRLYDPRSGTLRENQVVLIRGDRIVDVGSNLPVPPGAKVVDLSRSTVMPGMVDVHIHSNVDSTGTPAQRALNALASVQLDLDAGFTSVLDMDSRGGFNTVDLRDMINAGVVQGPRMQVVGQSLNFRNAGYLRDPETSRFYSGYSENKNFNGPWLARAAVREAKNHGVDYVKIYSTEDYVAGDHMWTPDGQFQFFYSLTLEEVQAAVDEAHRLGIKVGCHSYGGDAKDPCLVAGVDHNNHLLTLTDDGVKMLLAKHLPYTPTIDDLLGLEPSDLKESGGRNSRLALLEKAVRKAHAAGVELAFGSGATTPPGGEIPHGEQANQFPILQKWGLSPVEVLRMTYITSPKVLNYHMDRQVGVIEKGRYADLIAVAGDPLRDLTEMQRVRFVMKGGVVVRDDASAAAAASRAASR